MPMRASLFALFCFFFHNRSENQINDASVMQKHKLSSIGKYSIWALIMERCIKSIYLSPGDLEVQNIGEAFFTTYKWRKKFQKIPPYANSILTHTSQKSMQHICLKCYNYAKRIAIN